MTFWSSYWWPAVTALIGFIYVALLLTQWNRRRKPHQLAWATGFFLYAAAAGMEWYSEYTQNWDPTVYRIYIVFAASMVGFLGLGTLYLITKKRIWGDLYLAFTLVMLAIFLWGAFTVELDYEALQPGIVVGGAGLGSSGSFPRVMSLFFNIPGTLLVLGGAAWSVVRFWPKKQYRYRAWANVLIFLGTLCIAAAGSMARAGVTEGLYFAEMIASAILLAGFLMASTLEKGVTKTRAKRQEQLATADDDAG
ncbi:MAG TPA: hypothetical protein VLA05_00385 [Coriobacteriia bacterium]|nr:hypothetical protein [Coriobacteriia bacterium]